MARSTRGLTSGDTRIARLARWLQQVPTEVWSELRIETKQSGEWTNLQSYPRHSVSPDLATEIDATLLNVANECAEYVTARAVWFDPESEKYFTGFPMRVQPDDLDSAQAFSGEGLNTFIQTQRHLESMARLHVGGFGSAIRALETSNTQQAQINEDLREMNNELRAREAQLVEENARLSRELESAIELLEELEKTKPENDQNAQIIQYAGAAIRQQIMTSAAAPAKAAS